MPIFNFQKEASLPKSNQKGDHKRNRNICVTVRMTEDEKLQLEGNFKNSFVESKQAYMLAALLDKPVPTKGKMLQDKQILEKLDDLLVQVRGMATNVNQITRHIHSTKDTKTVEDFNDIADKLTDVLDELITEIQKPLLEFPHAKKEIKTPNEKKRKEDKEKRKQERMKQNGDTEVHEGQSTE